MESIRIRLLVLAAAISLSVGLDNEDLSTPSGGLGGDTVTVSPELLGVNVSMHPPFIPRMLEASTRTVVVTMTTFQTQPGDTFLVTSSDLQVATVLNVSFGRIRHDNVTDDVTASTLITDVTGDAEKAGDVTTATPKLFWSDSDANGTMVIIRVNGIRLGKAMLKMTLIRGKGEDNSTMDNAETETELLIFDSYRVVVLRARRLIDLVYQYGLLALLCFINFLFGCDLDLQIVWGYIKKPIPPAIGFASQYLLMPLLGLAITVMLRIDPTFGLGLIAISCAPGGGASNSWTILFGGDINLSLTMTFLSITLALGMMPFWMFVTTKIYFSPGEIQIPYLQILITLSEFIIPCLAGVLLRKFLPKIAKKLAKAIKAMSLVFLMWVLIFGTYVNFYMWRLMVAYPIVIAAGTLLPWCGFLFGFGVARICRQPRMRAITIAIETGIQNIGIPILLLMGSFPQPEGDIAATMAVCVGVFTPIPLYIALIVITVKRRCSPEKTPATGEADAVNGGDVEGGEDACVTDNTETASVTDLQLQPAKVSPGTPIMKETCPE